MPRSALVDAVTVGLARSGVRLTAGYPGYPVTEILEALCKSGSDRTRVEWTINERAAVELCMGASFSGARSLAVMKNHGLNTVIDHLTNWSYTGVRGGAVLLVGDDIGAQASQNETDSRVFAPITRIPLAEPACVYDVAEMLPKLYAFSEEFDTPAIMRITNMMADNGNDFAEEPAPAEAREFEFIPNSGKYFIGPANFRPLKNRMQGRIERLRSLPVSPWNELDLRSKEHGIVACGASYCAVRKAFPDASVLKVGMPYPLCEADVRRLVDHLARRELTIFEQGDPVARLQLLELANVWDFTVNGMDEKASPECGIRPREGRLCPACPHRAILYALKSLNICVMGDAGCSALSSLPPMETVHAHTAMGASIGMATGINSLVQKKLAAVIGDAAFFHSGINAMMNALARGVDLLVVILDNRVAGMTGGQVTVRGRDQRENAHFEWVRLLTGLGFEPGDIAVTSEVFAYGQLRNIIERLYPGPGVKVLVLVGKCAYTRSDFDRLIRQNYEDGTKKKSPVAEMDCPAILSKDDEGFLVATALCKDCTLCEPRMA